MSISIPTSKIRQRTRDERVNGAHKLRFKARLFGYRTDVLIFNPNATRLEDLYVSEVRYIKRLSNTEFYLSHLGEFVKRTPGEFRHISLSESFDEEEKKQAYNALQLAASDA